MLLSVNGCVQGPREASELAEARGSYEGDIERTAVDALVVQVAGASSVQREPRGLPFAVGDGGSYPAVEKALQARGQDERAGDGAFMYPRAGLCVGPRAGVHGALVRQQAFW